MTHKQKALELFSKKIYCSQAVLASFSAELGLDEEQALLIGSCFGGGMCKAEVCGACTGALMALGLRHGQCRVGDTAGRERADRVAAAFLEAFAAKNGSYICRELLGCDISTPEGLQHARQNGLYDDICTKMIADAVELVEQML